MMTQLVGRKGKYLYDFLTSRVLQGWIITEAALLLLCFILLFFLPGSDGGLIVLVFISILLIVGVGVFSFYRYRLLEIVKDQQVFLSEKSTLEIKLVNLSKEISKVEQAKASNQFNENHEIENKLEKIQKEYLELGLTAIKIESGNIPGIGPILKEKLKDNRIITAIDIGPHLQYLEGFGDVKVQELLNWKRSILSQLELTKPEKLSEPQLSDIRQKYTRSRVNLEKTRESHQLKHTELRLELENINRNLFRLNYVTFINYLSLCIFGGIKNPILIKRRRNLSLCVVISIVVLTITFCIISGGSLIVASVPTYPLTSSATFTLPPTSSYTPYRTPKLTLTSTATIISTITPTLSRTLTPTSPATHLPSPTLLPIAAACVPDNTFRQVGLVVNITDGDTIDVKLDDGMVYTVRYIGMDTPEQGETGYGPSADENSKLVFEKQVTLITDVSDTDQYNRLLRYVVVGDIFVNYELVRSGLAFAKDYPPDSSCASTFTEAQQYAKSNILGLWALLPSISSRNPPNGGNCDPAYPEVCIPSPPPDLDCADIQHRRFKVLPPDPHNFDRDHDGIGCESG